MCGLFAAVKPVPTLRVRLVRMRQQTFSSTSHAHTSHEHALSPFLSPPVLQTCVAAYIDTTSNVKPVLFSCAQIYYVVSLSQALFLRVIACAQPYCISHTYITLLLLRARKITCRFIHNRTHEQWCCCLPCCYVVPTAGYWVLNSLHARSHAVVHLSRTLCSKPSFLSLG